MAKLQLHIIAVGPALAHAHRVGGAAGGGVATIQAKAVDGISRQGQIRDGVIEGTVGHIHRVLDVARLERRADGQEIGINLIISR